MSLSRRKLRPKSSTPNTNNETHNRFALAVTENANVAPSLNTHPTITTPSAIPTTVSTATLLNPQLTAASSSRT